MSTQFKLTDDQVLEIREKCSNDNTLMAEHIADSYGVSGNTLIKLVRGDTYKHLPNSVPTAFKRGGNRVLGNQSRISDDFIRHLITNRNRNPIFWTWAELARECNSKNKTNYRGDHVKRLVLSFAKRNNLKVEEAVTATSLKVEKIKPRKVRVEETIPPLRRKQLAEKLYYLRSNGLI